MLSKLNEDLQNEISIYLNDYDAIQLCMANRLTNSVLEGRCIFIKNRYHAWVNYMCQSMNKKPLFATLLLGRYEQMTIMMRSGLFRKEMNTVYNLDNVDGVNLLTYCASYFPFEIYSMVYDLYKMEGVETYVNLDFVEKRRNTVDKLRIQDHLKSIGSV